MIIRLGIVSFNPSTFCMSPQTNAELRALLGRVSLEDAGRKIWRDTKTGILHVESIAERDSRHQRSREAVLRGHAKRREKNEK